MYKVRYIHIIQTKKRFNLIAFLITNSNGTKVNRKSKICSKCFVVNFHFYFYFFFVLFIEWICAFVTLAIFTILYFRSTVCCRIFQAKIGFSANAFAEIKICFSRVFFLCIRFMSITILSNTKQLYSVVPNFFLK